MKVMDSRPGCEYVLSYFDIFGSQYRALDHTGGSLLAGAGLVRDIQQGRERFCAFGPLQREEARRSPETISPAVGLGATQVDAGNGACYARRQHCRMTRLA
ncbi:hypothetical protein [Polaromonas sp.]|jgi:hypothetical protein|uniref:hypothetical protein n=1 Tax=Polaromonas sp. TaxID=1869339 RepID=UPI002CD09C35|nr:hypothetical protein [Polaromonas sp.]HQS92100.1 hypothetical protein [Polaromonas sp.]